MASLAAGIAAARAGLESGADPDIGALTSCLGHLGATLAGSVSGQDRAASVALLDELNRLVDALERRMRASARELGDLERRRTAGQAYRSALREGRP
jgi:hypothetical protein